jgi:hypothetical protein
MLVRDAGKKLSSRHASGGEYELTTGGTRSRRLVLVVFLARDFEMCTMNSLQRLKNCGMNVPALQNEHQTKARAKRATGGLGGWPPRAGIYTKSGTTRATGGGYR